MKNVVLIAIITTVTACDGAYNSAPAGNVDQCAFELTACEQSEGEAVAAESDALETIDKLNQQIAELQARLAGEQDSPEYAQVDWQARAEYAESELLALRANQQINAAAYDGILSRVEDLEDVILTLDFGTRTYNCDNDNWAQWICESYLHN